MAEVTKYQLITNNNNIISDIKPYFSVFKLKKSTTFIYAVFIIFLLFTLFLAFSPSSTVFTAAATTTTSSSDQSSRSHFSSFYSYFFPNSTQSNSEIYPSRSYYNESFHLPMVNNSVPTWVELNKTRVVTDNSSENGTVKISEVSVKQQSKNESSTVRLPEVILNSTKSADLTATLSRGGDMIGGNDGVLGGDLVGCDLYDGRWVKDESLPLYKPGSCKLIDQQFNCFVNGRLDNDYYKLKWKPNACSLPRLNAKDMLKLLKGKRLVFVGDSLNRNMWESIVCILKSAVKNKKKVYEAFGRHHFRTEASYSFVFKDYKCTVEFYVSPFLVQQWEVTDKNETTKETLRLDRMVSDADQYKSADYIVFNTGHWWTHDKTSKGEDYYQEGSLVYKRLDVKEAFRRALTTWARWVDANINPLKTHVLFRGYSASHFRGGQWNAGGKCDGETEPIKNDTYLTPYPWKMKVFESVIKEMKTPVSYLNVTRLTDYRKDGHPSVYRKHLSDAEKKSPLKYQDCSHWCLPGVPDSWNELLYAELLRKAYIDKQLKNKT